MTRYSRVHKNAVLDHFSSKFKIKDAGLIECSSPCDLELIVMGVFRIPEGMYVYAANCLW